MDINLEKFIKAEEVDHNMILDVPEEIGLKIQKIIEGIEEKGETVNIEILQSLNDVNSIEESRKLVFKINDSLFPITILDYPCVIEACKTMDYKSFYKSGDISQMMYVNETQLEGVDSIKNFVPLNINDPVFRSLLWKKDPDHLYKTKHGLTKPTRDIRQKRFKAKKRYNKEEISSVCKKLKHIIDNGAANFEKCVNADGELIPNAFEVKSKYTKEGASNIEASVVNSEYGDQSENNKESKIRIPNLISITNEKESYSNKKFKENSSNIDKNSIHGSFNLPKTSIINSNLNTANTNNSQFINTNISLNLREEDDVNIQKEMSRINDLKKEFHERKIQYEEIKKVVELNETAENVKQKKAIKKSLKKIKKEFEELSLKLGLKAEKDEEESN